MKTAPKITWRYVDDGGELALFWTSPWGGAEEKIATFWWPGHPPEATEEVEKMFEAIAARACLGIGPPINAEFLRSRLGPSLLEQLEGADARPLRTVSNGSGSSVGRAPKQGDARHDCEAHQDRMPGNATEDGGSSPPQILPPKTVLDGIVEKIEVAHMNDYTMFSDPDFRRFAEESCKKFGIKLMSDPSAEMRSWVAGSDTIGIGNYNGDEELMAVSLAHELGHVMVPWEFKERSDFNTLMIELEAWHLGVRYALDHFGLVFTDKTIAWGYLQALGYKGHDERERAGWVYRRVVPWAYGKTLEESDQ